MNTFRMINEDVLVLDEEKGLIVYAFLPIHVVKAINHNGLVQSFAKAIGS